MKYEKIHMIYWGDDFLFSLLEYQSNRTENKLSRFLNTNKKGLSQKASYRAINHWEKNGLIDDDRPEGKGWRKFSIVEMVWISLIAELREFGFPLEKILRVKENLKNKGEVQRDYKVPFPVLEFFIALAYSNKEAVSFLVFSDGNVGYVTNHQYNTSTTIYGMKNHVRIDLNEIVQRLFPDTDLKPVSRGTFEVFGEEFKLMYMVRMGNYETITVRLKNKKITILEATENMKTDEKILEILRKGSYQDIELKQADGKVVNIKRTIKKKL